MGLIDGSLDGDTIDGGTAVIVIDGSVVCTDPRRSEERRGSVHSSMH